ncbi:Sugar transporter SWEET [Aphelenchoides besseyi]|nr:Sugar transporter SWEET [Aphelenchoides besseyi]KAI6229241.1 Sugar transporter SWEET [Aphelenchoides besseyi]
MDSDSLLSVLSVTATTSTFALFLCGLQICQRIRQRGSTDGTSVAPFLLTLISCTCWLGYGELRKDQTIIFVNGVGFTVQAIYLYYYYIKTRSKSLLNRLLFLELVIAIGTYWFIYSDVSKEEKENLLGLVCMILNVSSIGSPLLDVGQVVRTKSTESLPFLLCAGNMAVSLQWVVYGILVDDFYMKVPNSIAVLISAVQLSLFIIYPSDHRVVHQKIPSEFL